MISGTELCAKFIPDGATISDATASKAPIRQTSPIHRPKRLHALLLFLHDVIHLFDLILVPFEGWVVILFNIGVVGPVFHFGICPDAMILPRRITVFVTHARR